MTAIKSLVLVSTLCGAMLAAYPAAAAAVAPAAASASGARQAQLLLALAEEYYQAQVRFDPVGATFAGTNQRDDELTMTIRPEVRARQFALLHEVSTRLMAIDRSQLAGADAITYDCLNHEINAALALEAFPDHLLPINHMESMPVLLANLGSGQSAQPIATVAQYRAYLKRIAQLPAWIDAAIANMRAGIKRGVVQPTALIVSTLPQIKGLDAADVAHSPFYAPIRKLPAGFSARDKAQLGTAYRETIGAGIAPAVRRLAAFLEKEYLPATRATAGWGGLPEGAAWYRAWVANQTTTALTPEQIHRTGLAEMARINAEFERLGPKLGYSGAPAGLANWLASQPKYRPFKTEAEILAAYRAIDARIAARLPEMFGAMPRTAMEIRPEPELTRATASDHYTPAAADGSRPGVFWAVVPDAGVYASTRMTSLLLHEGQPGHHFQITKQQELSIPKFRKFGGNNAYVEGWALYAESLGKEIGLYEDANAYAGHLMLDQRRNARLVVDTGLHAMGWTREQTIKFLVEQVGDSEAAAVNATERYMAWPGQALGYKVGALKIKELRARAERELGPKFRLAAFHDAVLADGSLPLALLESKIHAWISSQQ